MKKKRMIGLALALALTVGLAAPAFAVMNGDDRATPGQPHTFVSEGNPTYALNAYSWGAPSTDTWVTVYQQTVNDANQRWVLRNATVDGNSYYAWVASYANQGLVIGCSGQGGTKLMRIDYTYSDTQRLRVAYEGYNYVPWHARYGFANVTKWLSLTAASYTNGGYVQWLPPNSQNNQLWVVNWF